MSCCNDRCLRDSDSDSTDGASYAPSGTGFPHVPCRTSAEAFADCTTCTTSGGCRCDGALAAGFEGWQARQAAAAQDADTPDVTKDHSALLQQAARVSSAVLICHRDMWEFITAHAGRHAHFRVPPQITDHGNEQVSTTISGRSLIAVLISLYSIKHSAEEGDGDWELATTLYHRIHHR